MKKAGKINTMDAESYWVKGLIRQFPVWLLDRLRPNINKHDKTTDGNNPKPEQTVFLVSKKRISKAIKENQAICEQKQKEVYEYTEYWDVIENENRDNDKENASCH